MSINQHYLGTPVIIPPAPAALVIADYLRYYQYRVSDTSYRPYVSVAEANASVNVVVRPGRVVLIGNTEYWWKDSTSDNGLIKKGSGIRTVNTVGPDASGNVNLPVTAATATNLSVTTSATQVSVESSTGKNAVLLAADNSNAGLLLPAEKAIIAATSGANTGDQDISGIAANATAISAQATRLNTLVTGAPPALDTLPKIAAQLASDESGVAAILATQQQHTQQIALKADLVNGIVPYTQLPSGTLLLTYTTGEVKYFTGVSAAIAAMLPGASLRFGPGQFGAATDNITIVYGSSIILDPRTVWTFSQLLVYPNYNNGNNAYPLNVPGTYPRLTIHGQGDGQLVGSILRLGDGPGASEIALSYLRHMGNCSYDCYPSTDATAVRWLFRGVRGIVANGRLYSGTATNDYLTAFTRGGNSVRGLLAEFTDCDITAPLGSLYCNTSAAADASDLTRNKLSLTRSTFAVGGAAGLISAVAGIATYEFSACSYSASIAVSQPNTLSLQYLGLPAGGTGGADYTLPAPTALTPTAGTVTLDFAANPRRTLAATGGVAFTTANRSTAGAEKTVRVTNAAGAAIALSYEAWGVFGAALPTSLAAGKTMILTLTCYGTSVSDVDAAAVIKN